MLLKDNIQQCHLFAKWTSLAIVINWLGMESSQGLDRYKRFLFCKFHSTNSISPFALGFADHAGVPGLGSVKAKVSWTSLNLLEP